ncbi:MAG: class I SAM-dependent RNA methyltransferase, partial [Terriglobia bacterium]
MDAFTVRVEKLVYGGDGLAYHAGKPVFVPFVLPGEVVDVLPIEESRKLIRALPAELKQPAAERIEPGCRYFGRCGGCHYQHLPYERQLELKKNILRETLRRIGKLDWAADIPAHASPPWEYRNRVQWKLAPHPAIPDALQVGYYRAGSRWLMPVESCPISSPKLNRLLEVVNRLSAERALPLGLRGLEAFVDHRDDTLWLTLSAPRIEFDAAPLIETLRTELDGLLSIELRETARGQSQIDGLGWTYTDVGRHRFRVSHCSFFQANRHLLGLLAERVTHELRGKVALDLYAGVGLLSRALAEKFERLVAVEAHPRSAADLKANLEGLEGSETHAGTVEDFLQRSPEK